MADEEQSFERGQEPLVFDKCPVARLRNYATNDCFPINGPKSNLYQDCRHQVCTNTYMYYSPYIKTDSSKNWPLPDFTTDQVVKESRDFLKIYHQDKQTSKDDYEERLKEIEDEIRLTGNVSYSTDELRYGCQLAWRNAARCINRLYWQTMDIIDRRDVKTNDEMFHAICDHIRHAYNGGKLGASVLVLPLNSRMWSSQYLRFACYEQEDGTLLGDPSNQELTRIAVKLGWNKPTNQRTQWDLLPIIVQSNVEEPPSWYELPDDCKPIVYLSHPEPKYDVAIKKLGLRWVAQPFVADKAIEIGGMVFKSVPFSGWFMQTEIGRNLCDLQRYNFIPQLAEEIGMDVTLAASSQLNIDRLYVEVNAAVLHSFQKAQITITDHHNAAEGFMKFLKQDIADRGNTPCDWVWIVPPISGGMSLTFHQEMMNYLVKPCVLDQHEPWTAYFEKVKRKQGRKSLFAANKQWKLMENLLTPLGLAIKTLNKRTLIIILYASTTGTAFSYAKQMSKRLYKEGYRAKLVELDKFIFKQFEQESSILFIITSTFGRGNAPSNGLETEDWMAEKMSAVESEPGSKQRGSLKHYLYAVCAIGSKAYEDYCLFGINLDSALDKLGSHRIASLGLCDGLDNQYKSYCKWESETISALNKLFPVDTDNDKPTNDTSDIDDQDDDENLDGKLKIIELEFYDKVPEIKPNMAPYTKDNPYVATVTMNRELIKRDIGSQNDHSVRQIEFEIDSKVHYLPGDHVYVFPENPKEYFEELLQRCGMKPEDPNLDKACSLSVLSDNNFWTLRDLGTQYFDLVSPLRPPALDFLSGFASVSEEQRRLEELVNSSEAYSNWAQNFPTLLETLNEFPSIQIVFDKLIQVLPVLQPRPYSISSSPRTDHNKIQITVSVAEYLTPDKTKRKGLCSNFLQGVKTSSEIRLFVNPNPHFRLPGQVAPARLPDVDCCSLTLNTPLLLFAVGSGLAPFRSFWEEIVALSNNKEPGKVDRMLFFGCRTPNDFLYQDELTKLAGNQLITDLVPAFSRVNPEEKRYVQDEMMVHQNKIYLMLVDKKAFVYLCGSAAACMAIEKALATILSSGQGINLTFEQARDRIRKMKKSGRIQVEMFG